MSDGAQGEQGKQGARGTKGDVGRQGESSPAFKRGLLVIFLFMMTTFGYLGYLLDAAQGRTDAVVAEMAIRDYEACVVQNDNDTRFNRVIDSSIANTQANSTLTQAEKDQRIEIYRGIRAQLVKCTPPDSEE